MITVENVLKILKRDMHYILLSFLSVVKLKKSEAVLNSENLRQGASI